MQLSDLTAYAANQYHIAEEHKWAEFPGFSVLTDPNTGKWLALLIRQWDMDSGVMLELCDLKCGVQSLRDFPRPYLSAPYRMRGEKWIGVRFDSRTEPELVFRLFDRAYRCGEQRGFTLVLENLGKLVREGLNAALPKRYQDTELPSPGERAVPEQIRKMRRLYVQGDGSLRQKCKNFYTQARFMEDYEDTLPWTGEFHHYFPGYQDLSVGQLRAYFAWRAGVRRGDFKPIPTSAAYLYVYELLNGVGAADPRDRLRKLRDFEKGYLDSGVGEESMRRNLHRWMLELAVVLDLPPEEALLYLDEETRLRDRALSTLRSPEAHSNREIYDALCLLGGSRLQHSPVTEKAGEDGARLFAEVWRLTAARHREGNRSLFVLCFGQRRSRRWHPLENALYCWPKSSGDRSCALNEVRSYSLRGGLWTEQSYQKLSFDKKRLDALLHETDRQLRLYFKTGRVLKEKPEEAWAAPYVKAVIETDRSLKQQAARPKLSFRPAELDRIRRDAAETRESLLTDDEREETPPPPPPPKAAAAPVSPAAPLPAGPRANLTREQRELLLLLLRGESAGPWIAARHGMASVLADELNEALFDELGDSAVDCDGEELRLVEDYRDELEQILEGDEA